MIFQNHYSIHWDKAVSFLGLLGKLSELVKENEKNFCIELEAFQTVFSYILLISVCGILEMLKLDSVLEICSYSPLMTLSQAYFDT